jgi:hypothetical protein
MDTNDHPANLKETQRGAEAPRASAGDIGCDHACFNATTPIDVAAASTAWQNPSIHNLAIDGRLTVHYASRDVHLSVDGATAMHLMSMWQRRPSFVPTMNPAHTNASSPLIGVSLESALALTWTPCDPDLDGADRFAIEPIR